MSEENSLSRNTQKGKTNQFIIIGRHVVAQYLLWLLLLLSVNENFSQVENILALMLFILGNMLAIWIFPLILYAFFALFFTKTIKGHLFNFWTYGSWILLTIRIFIVH